MNTTPTSGSTSASATSPFLELQTLITNGQLDNLDFRATLVDGKLSLIGLLADQAAIDAIPVGMYVLEKDGTLIRFNTTAVAAWGRTPALGVGEKYCGAHILRYPSGELMPHEKAPPSVVINNGATVRNADVICEQPSGARLLALVNIFPVRDEQGEVIGAVNIFRHNTTKSVPGLN